MCEKVNPIESWRKKNPKVSVGYLFLVETAANSAAASTNITMRFVFIELLLHTEVDRIGHKWRKKAKS
jgi:formate hydrogenlyase subunit 3/multisubunit Na+/H+ antiporter MnhD subunit